MLNTGAGLLTSIALIYFYDLVLLKQNEQDKTLKKRIALDSLYKILDDHYRHIIYGMFRSASLTERQITSLDYLVSDEYFNEVEYLDLNRSPYLDKNNEKQDIVEDYSFIPRNYQIILDYNKRLAQYLLNEVLIVYGQFLEAELCEVIQEFRFSPFVIYSHQLPQLTKWHSQAFFKMLSPLAVKGTIAPNGFDMDENKKLMSAWKKHNELFIKIVEMYNQDTSNKNKFDIAKIVNDVKIEWGHCRIKNCKVEPGKYSLEDTNGETDINKIMLGKIIAIEEQLKKVLGSLYPENKDETIVPTYYNTP
ncbi:hypothetical protein SAMN04490178_12748 [Propionispora vibrioides]|uniref:Uncharacterized protein n=1 Tax=Propionispora vibrioides TaxID=112903 RepID=A0A1H8XQ31_9FIRM|nr:hypothetical protein SAMN04490178_12748 [Propionispora vibrioides]